MSIAGSGATLSQIFVLGLAIKLGGCIAAWHRGFQAGVWGFFLACLLVGTGYSMLNLCVAEITSIIVFPGGHFGYVRASLGPFWGYMAGMMGLVESVFLVALSMLKVSQALRETFAFSRLLVAIFWWSGYLFILFLHVRGGTPLWQFVLFATAITVLSLLIYMTGSIYFVDVNEEAYSSGFEGDALNWFALIYLPCWFFVGIDLLPTTSEEVVEASKTIPRAVLSVMAVMGCVCIWLQVVVAGLEPLDRSYLYDNDHMFPLSYGFGLIFGIHRHYGTAFSIAPSFLSSFGFLFAAGRQVNAMARSGLLPAVLSTTYGANKTPAAGMLLVSVTAFVVLSCLWYLDQYIVMFRIAISGSCIVYILVMLSFIRFRTSYSTMIRQFTNPLGVPSAVVGILCFSLVEVCVLFIFPIRTNFSATYGFLGYVVLCIVYYWSVVVKAQTFSEDEQKIFMRAYVINANSKRKRVLTSRAKQANGNKVVVQCNSSTRRGSSYTFDTSEDTVGRTTSVVFPVSSNDEVEDDRDDGERPNARRSLKPGAGPDWSGKLEGAAISIEE